MSETASNNTFWIDLDLVDIPPDAREHTESDIEDMAAQLKEEGQIQNIVVLRKGDRYQVVAGARRTKGARLLGWKQIKADVRENLSEYERLDLMFSENEGRVEANPLYQAKLLKRMQKESQLTQTAFAEKLGKTSAWLSQYFGLLQLPEQAQDILTTVKISGWALRALRRLPTPELQIQLAQQVKQGLLMPEDVEKRVNELTRAANQEEIFTCGLCGQNYDLSNPHRDCEFLGNLRIPHAILAELVESGKATPDQESAWRGLTERIKQEEWSFKCGKRRDGGAWNSPWPPQDPNLPDWSFLTSIIHNGTAPRSAAS
jgi:ParB/RepB/Spo0J family partition protein